jgi:hypothetical protein
MSNDPFLSKKNNHLQSEHIIIINDNSRPEPMVDSNPSLRKRCQTEDIIRIGIPDDKRATLAQEKCDGRSSPSSSYKSLSDKRK